MDVVGELAVFHRLGPGLVRELVTFHLLELARVPRDRLFAAQLLGDGVRLYGGSGAKPVRA